MKTILITAGGTSEPIDGVRKITNMGTGKMGKAICEELLSERGEEIEMIYYLSSSHSHKVEGNPKVCNIDIEGTFDLKHKMEKLLSEKRIDVVFHSMAISDYTTDYVSSSSMIAEGIVQKLKDGKLDINDKSAGKVIEDMINSNTNIIDKSKKISSSEDNLMIKLKKTPKIISMIKDIQPETYLVGFKLLNGTTEDNLYKIATELMQKNNCDLVLANDLANIKAGEHKAMIIGRDGEKIYANGKEDIARKLVSRVWEGSC